MTDELTSFLNYLEEKYGRIQTFEEYLAGRYGILDAIEKCDVETGHTERAKEGPVEGAYLTFACDRDMNLQIIHRLMDTGLDFREDIMRHCADEMTGKLIGNYEKELKKLSESKDIADGEKTADKFRKILKKTLMKLWGGRQYPPFIRKYFQQNNIQMEEYVPGHKISDDEFELLDEKLAGALSVKSKKASDKYKVIKMIQPIVKINYIDEDDDGGCKLLPGSCEFYV